MRSRGRECRLWACECPGGVRICHSCCVGDSPSDHTSHVMSMQLTSMGPSPMPRPSAGENYNSLSQLQRNNKSKRGMGTVLPLQHRFRL